MTHVYGIPYGPSAATLDGRRRVATMRAEALRRFKDRLRAGSVPTSPAVLGRKFRALQLAEMAIATRPTANPDRPRQSLRAAAEIGLVIEGLVVPFGQAGYSPSDPGRSHRVARDAFGGVLDGRTPLVTRHSYSGNLDDSEEVLAHTLSGLRLWTDDTGLRFRARLRDTRLAAIVVNKIRHGELAGVSATYRVDASEYGDTAKLITRCRELEEISLLFDSDRPAFQGTWARILHVPVGMSIYSPDFRDHASATAADSARRQLGLRVLTPTGG